MNSQISESVKLLPHQEEAYRRLRTGSVLCGGVGSGKTITSLYYFFEKVCDGKLLDGCFFLQNPKKLFVITTATKRDTRDWEREFGWFLAKPEVEIVVDSWNNISRFENIYNSFFVFDEQRVLGNGAWVKSFLKIVKKNDWILLSATPGDTWVDYVPIFLAHGFYKTRTEFIRRHVVYNTFVKFPKIDRYVETDRLERLRSLVLIIMPFEKKTKRHVITVNVDFDRELYKRITDRWNPFENRPIKDISDYVTTLRKSVNSHKSRFEEVLKILVQHKKIVVFYNYNYELDILRNLKDFCDVGEHNGHKHEPIPKTESWVYLVQYMSGAEGWNCVETNAMVFYSLNYSYRMMEQASGRIDRLNTSFYNLYYYYMESDSSIDQAIKKSLLAKKNFNAKNFA